MIGIGIGLGFGVRSGGNAPELTVKYEPTTASTVVGIPLQFTGNLDVDWDDGNLETLTGSGWKTHTYASAGTYIAKFDGAITQIWTSGVPGTQRNQLTEVISWGNKPITKIWMRGSPRLVSVPTSIPATVTDLNECFKECSIFNDPNIISWNTVNVTNLDELFTTASLFNQPIGNWNTINVTSMQSTFQNAAQFNGNISGWNTSNVTSMRNLFLGAAAFNRSLASWDVSKVTTMDSMFSNAGSFNGSILTWQTTLLVNCALMFRNASTFNQPINHLDLSGCTSMLRFLNGANAFNQPMDLLDVSTVTAMDNLFALATVFNQDLTGWCVTNIPSEPAGFSTSSALTGANKPVWGTCPP